MPTRKEAQELGLKFYDKFRRPCPKGHDSDRYTSNGTCVECMHGFMRQEKRKKYDKDYHRENKERRNKEAVERYYEDRENKIRKTKEWVIKNRDRSNLIKKAYKGRRRHVERKGVTGKELSEWANSQNKICYWCLSDCSENYHIDHYQPLSKGGDHSLDNLVIACPSCNLTKSAKDPYEFANNLGRLF